LKYADRFQWEMMITEATDQIISVPLALEFMLLVGIKFLRGYLIGPVH